MDDHHLLEDDEAVEEEVVVEEDEDEDDDEGRRPIDLRPYMDEVIIDDVAGEVIVDGGAQHRAFNGARGGKTKPPLYAASTLRTLDYLKGRPRVFVPSGRVRAEPKQDPSGSPPLLADPDGSYAVPSMKKMFRIYADSSLRKAEHFFQAASSSAAHSLRPRTTQPGGSGEGEEPLEEEEEQRGQREEEEGQEDAMDAQLVGGEVLELLEDAQHEGEEEGDKEDLYYEGLDERPVVFDLAEFDWPLFAQQPIDFIEACELLLGNIRLPEEKICKTTPHDYKRMGTFVVDWSTFLNRADISHDGLGTWGKPSGRTRFFALDAVTNKYQCVSDCRGQLPKGVSYDMKCQLKKYEHPTTLLVDNGANRFIKKVITCISKDMQYTRIAIITYEWAGTPFDFTYIPPEPRRSSRTNVPPPPDGARNWEAASFQASGFGSFPSTCTAVMGDCPLYSMGAIQFHDVCNIIMGATLVDPAKICDRIPQRFRECGTFVIDVDSLASEHEMRRDDNGQWGKPAGNSRYFKITGGGGQMSATRLDRSGRIERGTPYDLQILCKRYEHPMTDNRFVRKIYTGRSPIDKEYHHTSVLAVITYFWKGDPVPFDSAVPQRKVRVHNASEYELLKRDPGGELYEEELEEAREEELIEMGGRGEGGGGGGGRLEGRGGEPTAAAAAAMYMQQGQQHSGLEDDQMQQELQRSGGSVGGRGRKRKKSESGGIMGGERMAAMLQQHQQQRLHAGGASGMDARAEEEIECVKMALVNQQRFSMLLDRFESVAEKMERMTEMQMSMMWRGSSQLHQQHHHHHRQQQQHHQQQYVEEVMQPRGDGRESRGGGGGAPGEDEEEELYEEEVVYEMDE